MNATQHCTPEGKAVVLGDTLARGASAVVSRLADAPEMAVKIYRAGKRPERLAHRLQAMLDRPPADAVCARAGWPVNAVVSAETDAVNGYLMRLGPLDAVKADRAAVPAERRQIPGYAALNPTETAVVLSRAVANCAATLAGLHDAGYVVGDLNGSSLLVRHDGNVLLTDAARLQTPVVAGERHRCRDGDPEYQAPEIQRALAAGEPCRERDCPEGNAPHSFGYGCFDRAAGHDRFALAVLAYRLLCNGRHPYSGRVNAKSPPAPDTGARIRQGYFPYHKHGRRHIRPTTEQDREWQRLSPELREYFAAAFAHYD